MKTSRLLCLIGVLLSCASAQSSSRVSVWEPDFPIAGVVSSGRQDLVVYNFRDLDYYCYVALGTPDQRLRVALDSNMSDTWVRKDPEAGHFFYNHSKSTTYQAVGTAVDFDGLGGYLSRDRVGFGDSIALAQHSFVEVTSTPFRNFWKDLHHDGFLGLGWAPSKTTSTAALIPSLIQRGLLNEPVVGLSLRKQGNGLLSLGGIDSQSFVGEMHYTETITSTGAWAIPLDGVLMNGKPLVDSKDSKPIAWISSSSYSIKGPMRAIRAIFNALDRTHLPNITIVLDGEHFTITHEAYMSSVFFGFQPNGDSSDSSWTLGQVFLREFYTVFDYGSSTQPPRVGFAHIA
ncbi:hypothetical protein Poli38472_010868 [Pythium oligandrum]|uniref:Peptidase A1 domain-containing protein n=1 Tax=Pythium oligandrum TaxID=41045 RepID=A0A8K1CFE8_PYTOL|nr:hypothetical protein Poli38472_010868 [Pythium oligandrum]|eukprot:TMW61805.1 hypothetical protein Poli38472_010868 [Pythium oligandrum]